MKGYLCRNTRVALFRKGGNMRESAINENCRWATRTEQNENTRNNHLVTIDGKTQPLSAWVRERGLNYHTVSFRIHQKHMTPEQALEV